MTAFEERLRFDRAFKEIAQEFFDTHLRDRACFRRVGVEEKLKSAEMRQTRGSRTPIANLLVRVDNRRVFDLPEWVAQEFGVEVAAVRTFFEAKAGAFHK